MEHEKSTNEVAIICSYIQALSFRRSPFDILLVVGNRAWLRDTAIPHGANE
jgi:hypothetical protein